MIELQEVVVTYRKGRQIGPVTYQMTSGKIIALVGENGAGKSTIMKLIMGQLPVDSGTITGIPKGKVRYMPDDLNFPTTLKVGEIIELLGKLKGITKESQKEILKRADLFDHINSFVSELSKGMRQRLNFAQSLLGECDVYILDEPTNGLDPYWINRVKSILKEEKDKGQLILYSTHLLSMVEEMADEVIFIHKGQVLASGNISNLKLQYAENSLEALWMKLYLKEETS
ncbi:ABC transporter ATP-binding protein [Metasolibacillus sp.]|uniref:ABC transporter ATP-binding protein n=1 Tax=Metasolibacillus sp. TaxID=2703680 RepID=UPI0025EB42C8|nr:ABC transporter ATP-binding protein [Metasolibacillus sp.]MCT6925434.1 ABC transporter ATP-binding protein [Metasolibacillus sp.]MCT6941539.1 ABC transporter ATP-binding protein [Metasolibacillus sp.]